MNDLQGCQQNMFANHYFRNMIFCDLEETTTNLFNILKYYLSKAPRIFGNGFTRNSFR